MQVTARRHGKLYWPGYQTRNMFTNFPQSKEEHIQRLNDLVHKTGRKILELKAVFPFDFFPDKLLIDEYQVSIVNRIFFWSEQIRSIPIKDITDVTLETSLLFAALHIYTIGPSDLPLMISYLKKKDAAEAKNAIQGLREAYKENIDVGVMDSVDDVKKKVEFIGKGNAPPS